MTKLSDLQTILLSRASQRQDRSLLPVPEGVRGDADRIDKAISALMKFGNAEEAPDAKPGQTWRSDGDLRFGAVISDAGLVAIGIEPDGIGPVGGAGEETLVESHAGFERPTKAALVLALLQREQGATMAELMEATGWLPHTTRAALTGIRKKGHAVVKDKRDDVTCYSVAA
ncbi:DUF3489 domain-containing protein [Sphingomonas sp. Leaf343]|uniref:DUF3489 domain-containing protein n=1 Tax=Sphingomonas sp. Leaf343 TaxID=1736345 RepID=UPI0006FC748E|nr:DUF3489 domain-containing protein [Sphingomonas sp. Leaf343]KQR83709.1 hypothetical protein ASG07_08490 [Sphingomonas sp. Leaf343]